jgi:hypothetical protein
MDVVDTADYNTILQIVRDWPPRQRFNLVQEVLKTLTPEETSKRPQRRTLDQALGLLATDRPAPTDAEIAQWLDERRVERYG